MRILFHIGILFVDDIKEKENIRVKEKNRLGKGPVDPI
jgi:hypothetical protein